MSPDLSDYTAINRYLVFNGATTSQTVTVPIRDDMTVEDQFEWFFINLRNDWYDSAIVLDEATASVTIEDNDSELSIHCTKDCMCARMSFFFTTSVLIQWLQSGSMEPILCVKTLVALVSLYLY